MSRLRAAWWRVSGSLWFVPAVMVLGATLLAVLLVELDGALQVELAESWPRLFGTGAEGAREMLSAIAGSMITVAGVVFSVTIVALSLAAQAYSPRVLRTFMHDRPTQVALGVFVGIFAYCLVVLRTVRADGDDGPGFVPAMAVFGALLLALAGVAVLVYFIHHVALAIQIPTILQRIVAESARAIERLFPQELGGEGEDEDLGQTEERALREWRAIPARRSGYIVEVDAEGLLAFARERGALLRMELAVGEFVVESLPLASLAGAAGDAAADAKALDKLYTLGPERSIEQDAAFGIQQLVDIATRAVSPGINNPSTAAMCADHLSALLVLLARRRIPSRRRLDRGQLRVIAKGPTFDSLVALAFEPLLHHARNSPEALAALARALRAIELAATPHRRQLLRRHLQLVRTLSAA